MLAYPEIYIALEKARTNIINWASGDFRIGKHDINRTFNSLSHKVKWVKGVGGVLQIFPRKGDVWALYRHWSPKWNEVTPNIMIHNYDMVEDTQPNHNMSFQDQKFSGDCGRSKPQRGSFSYRGRGLSPSDLTNK
uniref:DUF3444 domain-containing protein n=1 Tax=Solanum lycopersicum TaxID=4081 RepID=K4D092_SOLLC